MENESGKPRDLLKNMHSDCLKRVQLTLSQGITKKRDVSVIADDDDDEERTNTSQNHVTATMSTEEFFLRTQ